MQIQVLSGLNTSYQEQGHLVTIFPFVPSLNSALIIFPQRYYATFPSKIFGFDHFIAKNACYVNQVRPNIQITSIFPFYLALDKQNQYFVQNLSGFFNTSVDDSSKVILFYYFSGQSLP